MGRPRRKSFIGMFICSAMLKTMGTTNLYHYSATIRMGMDVSISKYNIGQCCPYYYDFLGHIKS